MSEMASFVLEMMGDLKPHLIPMMCDTFSSHVIRTAMYILAGVPIDDQQPGRNALRSKRSARFSMHHIAEVAKDWKVNRFQVPPQFKTMLNEFASHIVSQLDTTKFRDLSFDATANPVIQASHSASISNVSN
jgi:hypothetical protein